MEIKRNYKNTREYEKLRERIENSVLKDKFRISVQMPPGIAWPRRVTIMRPPYPTLGDFWWDSEDLKIYTEIGWLTDITWKKLCKGFLNGDNQREKQQAKETVVENSNEYAWNDEDCGCSLCEHTSKLLMR